MELDLFVLQILSARGSELGERPTSPATGSNSPASGRAPSKHIISHEDIVICKTLGTGEFGTVQQGVWTNDDGDRVGWITPGTQLSCGGRD